MRKKILSVFVAVAVTSLFILPGLAFGKGGGGGGGGGTPSPPPSNPPCDADHHNGLPPPYGGPLINSLTCHLKGGGTGNATGNSTGQGTGNGTTGGTTTGGTTTGGTTTGGTTTGGTTTGGGALNECHWDITLGGTTVVSDSEIPGVLGLHVDLPPDAAGHTTGSLVHGCVGVGSVVNPTPTPCPTGTAPIEVQTDQASYVLLCILL
jgi:hypothetical protein